MIIDRGMGNGGIYFYFFCRGRKARKCDLPYLGMARVEAAVDEHFATVRLTDDFLTTIAKQFNDAMKFEHPASAMIVVPRVTTLAGRPTVKKTPVRLQRHRRGR